MYMKTLRILFFLLFVSAISYAQIITTVPAIITEDYSGEIEVIYDGNLGNGGLKGYTGDVYAHTGVKHVVGGSWEGAPTWGVNTQKYKMDALGGNKWKLLITPNMRDYYGITDASKAIKQLCFVFRSALPTSGTTYKEGKETGNKDIFVDVYPPGLSVVFSLPAQESTLVEPGTSLPISIQTTEDASIECYVGSTKIASATAKKELTTSYKFETAGQYEIKATAEASGKAGCSSAYVTVRSSVVNQARPAGIKDGINYINDNTVTLCLYAPKKNYVYAIGDFSDWKVENAYQLKKDGDYWWITLDNLTANKEYAFQYLVDGKIRIADPYTDKILDPDNDKWISSATYPNLKAYPEGKTTGIASVFQTAQKSYNWNVTNFVAPAKEKLVIYELLVRDFTTEHTFASTMAKLDYLQGMGVNAIELMPINEFEGNESWGYNPSFYFAVDKYYGTKDSFKAFVDECHRRGIAVIIDMVLNHSFSQSPLVQLYYNDATGKVTADNPWYNVDSPNTSYFWGYDFNHESKQTKAFVDRVNAYWLNEYKVDGFRFDFTKGFTNKSGDGWAYDASRIEILKRMNTEIKKQNPNAYVIFEHLTINSEEKVLANDADILLWGNMNNNYCQAAMSYNDTGGSWSLVNSIYKQAGFQEPNLIAYMESHDEERMMYKTQMYGKVSAPYNIKDVSTGLERAALCAAFYLPTPGPKMIWQFGELGYDYSINYCIDTETVGDCRVGNKPIRWDYFEDADRRELYNVYRMLNYLKATYPTFTSTDFSHTGLGAAGKYFVWRHAEMNAVAVGNFDVKNTTVTITFPKIGTWYSAFDKTKTISVTNASHSVTLDPGEFYIYTDKPINIPAGIDSPNVDGQSSSYSIYPNPVSSLLFISSPKDVNEVTITNINGVQVMSEVLTTDNVDVSMLPSGFYLISINGYPLKFIKK